MTVGTTLAKGVAQAAHLGQVDKAGQPYIMHPARLARRARMLVPSDPDIEQVAWLHDVVEDSSVTLDDLRERGFSARVVDAVDAITKREGEPLQDYYARVRSNEVAWIVKIIDVLDNLDGDRLAKLPHDLADWLVQKYGMALFFLRGEVVVPPRTDPLAAHCVADHALRPESKLIGDPTELVAWHTNDHTVVKDHNHDA